MKVRGPAAALAATAAALQLGGCVPPQAPPPTPEASFGACEAGALAELRRVDPAVASATLDSLAEAAVERRTPPAGQAGGGVALVIAGRGTAAGGGAGGRFRYTCLVGTAGPVLHVEVRPQGSGSVAAECADRPPLRRPACAGSRQRRTPRSPGRRPRRSPTPGGSPAGAPTVPRSTSRPPPASARGGSTATPSARGATAPRRARPPTPTGRPPASSS
jgi:hypothetical protein